MSSPSDRLYDILQDQQPQQVLVVSRSPIPALLRYQTETQCRLVEAPEITLTDIAGLDHLDLVLVADWLEHHTLKDGRLLLGALRNQLNPRILVAVNASAPWQFTDFVALGFRRDSHYAARDAELTDAAKPTGQQDLTFYSYDIASYNHKRTWNNSENWANPQNWGKYWW